MKLYRIATIFVLWLCVFLSGGTSFAKTLTETQIIKRYSYSDLVQVLNGVQLALGGDDWCSVSMDEAQKLILPLRPIYEKAVAQEKKAIQSAKLSVLSKRIKSCRSGCFCSSDEDVMAARKDLPKADSDWLKKNNSFTTEELKRCARQTARFCSDDLIPSLKSLWEKEYKSE